MIMFGLGFSLAEKREKSLQGDQALAMSAAN